MDLWMDGFVEENAQSLWNAHVLSLEWNKEEMMDSNNVDNDNNELTCLQARKRNR